jgi:hypothetical protein
MDVFSFFFCAALCLPHAHALRPANDLVSAGVAQALDKQERGEALRFWIWPSTIAQPDLQKAIDQVRMSGIETVADPARQPWTHVLLWNSDDWILLRAGQTDGEELGWTLTAKVLRQHVPPGAKVWINLPPSQEWGGKIKLHEEDRGVKGVANFTTADYLLVSALTPDGPTWAWYRKSAFEQGAQNLNAPPDFAHCAPAEQYPVRTAWILEPDANALSDAAAKLSDAAVCLARMTDGLRQSPSPEKK